MNKTEVFQHTVPMRRSTDERSEELTNEKNGADPRSSEGEREYIEICIEDTGPGIKPEDMPRLFKPFQQLESTYEKKHQGTGLGLVLCKKIVEMHGGRIWVESEWGKGSRFIFRIPVKRVE